MQAICSERRQHRRTVMYRVQGLQCLSVVMQSVVLIIREIVDNKDNQRKCER